MKKILISLLSIIFIISMITTVYAATGNISSGVSSDTVIKGKTFTVTLAATADSPIDGMYTKFTYDTNVLSLESASAGENYGNNSSAGEILVVSNATTSPTSATLYTMTFKVLDNANVESTTISFSESALHLNENGTMKETASKIDDVIIKIKADDTTVDNQGGTTTDDGNNKPESPVETPSNNSGTSNDSNNAGNNNDTDKKEEVKDDKNTSTNTNTNKKVNTTKNTSKNTSKNTTTKLPQTGAESISVIAVMALAAMGISSYVSYKKYKNI